MIISLNDHLSIEDFKKLMTNTDFLLNEDAKKRRSYYLKRVGSLLEDDVKDALEEAAKNTVFEGSIEKISANRFPDITVSNFYGVEVKSTKNNTWRSTGNSILEGTRVSNIERIYVTFGKLGGDPIEFLSRPYEECLYDIAITHMPRYLIDMKLKSGNTIFDKMNVRYDDMRMNDNPIMVVSDYYKTRLKKGEALWWSENSSEEVVSATIRLWKNLNSKEKSFYIIYGCVNYPEIFKGDYDRYALWLNSQGIVDTHIRDQFSSGGQEDMLLSNGEYVKFPAIYRRIKIYLDVLYERMKQQNIDVLFEEPILDNNVTYSKLLKWADTISKISSVDYEVSMDALKVLFSKFKH